MSFDFNTLGGLGGAVVGQFAPETGSAISSIFSNKPPPPPAPPATPAIFAAANAFKPNPVVPQGGIPTSYLLAAGAAVGLVILVFVLRK